LIPRPETETVIEQALACFPDRGALLRVLDLGTGTACLPVAFLKEFPNASGLGIDRSEEARAYARRNVTRHGLDRRCEIRGGDWAEAVAGPYDVILSNPPYIKTMDLAGLEPEVAYEPVSALDGGPDGLSAYRALVPVLARLLSPSGRAFIEIGAGQAGEVSAVLAQAGLDIIKVAPDLAGIPRVLIIGR
jgi:release factor glutamine methyltransferase